MMHTSNGAVILVPTCKRPADLTRVLSSFTAKVSRALDGVVVGDNDPDRTYDIEAIVAQFSPSLPIVYAHEPRQGLASIRNRLIEEGLARFPDSRFFVFVDDDMAIISDTWLTDLIASANATGASLVGGPNIMVCGPTSSAWLRFSPLAAPKTQPDGLCDHLDGTCNLLMRRTLFDTLPRPFFDERFNFVGGEDYDFFLKCKANGATMAWTNKATTHELRELTRLSRGYFMARLWNVGRYQALSDRTWLSPLARAKKFARISLSAFVKAPVNASAYGLKGAAVKFVYGLSFTGGYVTGYFRAPREMYRR